jgi:hypothetical protein
MIGAGRSPVVTSLFLCFSIVLLGTVRADCVSDPADCSDCNICLRAVRSGTATKVYLWVNDVSGDDPSPTGTCVQRFDPVGSNSARAYDSPALCGKTVFADCTNGRKESYEFSCPISKKSSGVSQLKISSSLNAGFLAFLALFVYSL